MSEIQALNADMSAFVRVDTDTMDWTASPSGTVSRKRLHLYGPAESGQVTSVVRYHPNAKFPEHGHPEGEEILVLEGVFSDQAGDWGPGSYLLNPEGFRHAPWSDDGCLIFVKLRQYTGEGRRHLALDTREMNWQPGDRSGLEIKTLYVDPDFPDRTSLFRLEPDSGTVTSVYPNGAEIFVISGVLEDQNGVHPAGIWLRYPPGGFQSFRSSAGCFYYIKEGGVRDLRAP